MGALKIPEPPPSGLTPTGTPRLQHFSPSASRPPSPHPTQPRSRYPGSPAPSAWLPPGFAGLRAKTPPAPLLSSGSWDPRLPLCLSLLCRFSFLFKPFRFFSILFNFCGSFSILFNPLFNSSFVVVRSFSNRFNPFQFFQPL